MDMKIIRTSHGKAIEDTKLELEGWGGMGEKPRPRRLRRALHSADTPFCPPGAS